MEQQVYTDPMVGEIIGHILSKIYYAAGGAATVGGLLIAFFTIRWRRAKKETSDTTVAAAHAMAITEAQDQEERLLRREGLETRFKAVEHRTKDLEQHHNNVDEALTKMDQANFVTRDKADQLIKDATQARQRELDALGKQVESMQRVIDRMRNGSN